MTSPTSGLVVEVTRQATAPFHEPRLPAVRRLCYTAPDSILLPDPPSARQAGARDQGELSDCALAYVARYGQDVPLLEHAWAGLDGVLLLAWQCGADGVVVALAEALARVVGRLRDHRAAERALQLGIGASRRIQDRRHLAVFLNRLGGLLCAHGQRERGARLWHISLRLAAHPSQGLWEPLQSFAVIADILPGHAAAHRLVEALRHERSHPDPDGLAVALFVRGLYARTSGELARAHGDFSACLRLLAVQATGAPPSTARQIFTLAARAELARAQHDYPRSHAYTTSALALTRACGDHYTLAALLVDQAWFAHQLGHAADARAALMELRAVMALLAAPRVYEHTCRDLERQITPAMPAAAPSACIEIETDAPHALPPAAVIAPAPLSAREREVLCLVAGGLSNQEVAARLVITVGTVKKHLEHIYTKLGAGSRTAAVAQARLLRII